MARVSYVSTRGDAVARDYESDDEAFHIYDVNRRIEGNEYVQMTYNNGRILRWLNPVVGGKHATVTGTRGKV